MASIFVSIDDKKICTEENELEIYPTEAGLDMAADGLKVANRVESTDDYMTSKLNMINNKTAKLEIKL